MRFSIKQAGCGSERIGCLSGFIKSPDIVIETPTSALFTQGGSVVHLTSEVLARVFPSPQLLWMPLSNTIQLEAGVKAQGDGVAKFSGLPGHVTCTTLHNINEVTPPGHFEHDKIPLWTKNGKKMVTADRYMDVMEVFKPDIILAIADGRTSFNDTDKRISKSVDRTCNMLDVCVKRYKDSKIKQESSLIGVIAGGSKSKPCNDCIEHILKHKDSLVGIALAGLTDGSEESLNVITEDLEGVFKDIDKTVPKDLIRIIEGCWNPAVVVAAIEHGWDVFDGSYPVKLTNAGRALALNFDVDQNSGELCILELGDIRYKEDFNPILEGCECLVCRKHTRAYIRHLLNTREMLANVLLNMHNLHHFDQMFHHARRYIATNTFQIFKCHITKQYELYNKADQSNGKIENGTESETDTNTTGSVNSKKKEPDSSQIKKKIRVSNLEYAQNKVANSTVV